ncbi:hypothetical protein TYRP_013410 [Tyrophagus putrescentiae]|nr:hypothetical protein TYRP_013410 [Tyrophagus putrescentiae]
MGNEETTSDFGIRVEDSIIYNSTSSFVDKHLEDEYLKGMMKIINKYKFGQGIAASVVNSFANDFLLLHQSIQPNNSSFKDYQKIALSEHLQEVYIEKTNPCYIEPLSLDKIQDIDGQMYDFKYSMTPLKSIISRALQNQSLVDHLYKEQHQNSSSFLSTVSLPNPLITNRVKGKLKLEVYIDDTQYSPSCMNKTQKFTCVYVSLADIPFHLRTKRNSIDIYMLINKTKFDDLNLKDTNYAVFHPMRSEIENINRSGGFRVSYSTDITFNIEVTLMSIVGDNLAIYPLLGFSGSFNPYSQPTLKWVSLPGKNGFKLSGSALQKTEAFLKMEAIFIDILNYQWPEYRLYKALREFVLLAFVPNPTSPDIRKFVTLAHEIMALCRTIQPEISIYCKLHHLCHYGDLTNLFGPLYLYSTFRYERIHQFGKRVMRSSKNFINLAVTINKKHQKERAEYLDRSHFKDTNLFEVSENNPNPVFTNEPQNCVKLPSSNHPYSTKKNILRKIDSRRYLYFLTTEFLEEEENKSIYCHGSVLRKKQGAMLNDNLFELEELYTNKYIKFTDLHYSNDFIFHHNSKQFLLEWIL